MGTHPDSPQKHPVEVGVSPGQARHPVLQVVLQTARFGTDESAGGSPRSSEMNRLADGITV